MPTSSGLNMNGHDDCCSAPTRTTVTADILRDVLPSLQPQEGSPANTFTDSEFIKLQAALSNLNLRLSDNKTKDGAKLLNICDQWKVLQETACQQEAPLARLNWHGAPKFNNPNIQATREFRKAVRSGDFTGPTNGVCPGFLQCNLVVLPQGPTAFDFLLFCQRNPQACPLLEVCDVGSAVPVSLAPTADLRTDCPKYAVYQNGKLVEELYDVTEIWPEDSVAFLIGCSFSYDGAMQKAGIPLRSAEQGRNVPMYRSNLPCRQAGCLQGHMVVSMKPIPALQISKHVEITSHLQHAHGGPVCIGRPDAIGIDLNNDPDWGDKVDMRPDEVPVFHACGVTPQSILMDCKVPFAITHAAGHMFVTDRPADLSS